MVQLQGSQTYLIGGMPGSGKSTVARLIAARFDRGICIPWDVIREDWVVSGRLLPWEGNPDEAGHQMMLGSLAAFQVAKTYANGGFGVVVDGPLPPIPEVLPLVLEAARELDPFFIYLHPRLEVVLRRLQERSGHEDDEVHIAGASQSYLNMERIRQGEWPVRFIDNSDLTPGQTVDAILKMTRV